jgi:A/G-specific adenine glycosylase
MSKEIPSCLFRNIIYNHYHKHPRILPWRKTTDPYHILVSEFMLQQTQIERVMDHYGPFIRQFLDFQMLSEAQLKDVLKQWQGLGYNRRAINLKETARKVMDEHAGLLPKNMDQLMTLPGIGRSTAGAVLAFAYQIPVAFIETNIRRVFIHFFFSGREMVKESEILHLVDLTLDKENPREWYYALMDYGALLKKQTPNPNRKSATYSRQAPFEGSNRQVRGAILRHLLKNVIMEGHVLITLLGITSVRGKNIISGLEKDGFLYRCGADVCLRT